MIVIWEGFFNFRQIKISAQNIVGQKQCNKERKEEDDPNSEESSGEEKDPNDGLPDDPEKFKPETPNWPTPSGKTEEDAKKKCTESLTVTATFKTCKKVLGARFNIKEAVEQCVADVLVRERFIFILDIGQNSIVLYVFSENSIFGKIVITKKNPTQLSIYFHFSSQMITRWQYHQRSIP